MEIKMAKEKETKQEQAHAEIYDLANRVARSTVAVVDALTSRGAFKGEELSTIGQLRDQGLQIIQLAETYQQEAAAES
jgi:hypothetical protein